MRLGNKKSFWIILLILLFGAGIAGGYFYFLQRTDSAVPKTGTAPSQEIQRIDLPFSAKIYYPSGGRLIMEERVLQRQRSITETAEEIIDAFLKGPSGGGRSDMPQGVRLLGAYSGSDGILYVDLSDELRRNFHGDALNEFLIIKGIYDTIASNVQGINDVKIIIEGRETESIGGHISILYPLKESVISRSGAQGSG